MSHRRTARPHIHRSFCQLLKSSASGLLHHRRMQGCQLPAGDSPWTPSSWCLRRTDCCRWNCSDCFPLQIAGYCCLSWLSLLLRLESLLDRWMWQSCSIVWPWSRRVLSWWWPLVAVCDLATSDSRCPGNSIFLMVFIFQSMECVRRLSRATGCVSRSRWPKDDRVMINPMNVMFRLDYILTG